MGKVKAVVEGVKAAAKATKTIVKGAAVKGQVLGKGVQKVAQVVSAHPAAATRIYGGVTAVSGIKDIKAYKTTRDKGTLVKGIAKLVIGAGLAIFNDKEWYLKHGDVTPARNTRRPMDPVYNTIFTDDATIGSVGKLMDINVDWQGYSDSLAFKIATTKTMSRIRENLKSNLPYDVDYVREYLVDSIAIAIIMAQMGRQFKYYRFAPSQFPNFYELWNKIAAGDEGYGPTSLVDLTHFSSSDAISTTIAVYDTLVDSINGHVRLPIDLAKFISYYFSNLFITDTDDSNSQYLAVRAYNIRTFLGNNNEGLHTINISQLNPSDFVSLIEEYVTKYAVIAADCDKSGVYGEVSFLHFKELTSDQSCVYSKDILQAAVNAYTSNSAVFDGFVRLDDMGDEVDDLTTFLFLGAIQDNQDTLYTPSFNTKSMVFKFKSNDTIDWDGDLKQGEFDFTHDFGFVIQTDIYADTITSINTEGSSQFRDGDTADNVTGTLSVNLSQTAGTSSLKMVADQEPGVYTKSIYTVNSVDLVVVDDHGTYSIEYGGTEIPGLYEQLIDSINGSHYIVFKDVSALTIDLGVTVTVNGTVSLTAKDTTKTSINYISVTGVLDEPNIVSVSGFTGYAGYIADQFDFHLPMVNTVRNQIIVNDGEPVVETIGSSMLKEAYTPYWYNIKDLGSILYNMFYSLFLPEE